jgi:hypothetical protein
MAKSENKKVMKNKIKTLKYFNKFEEDMKPTEVVEAYNKLKKETKWLHEILPMSCALTAKHSLVKGKTDYTVPENYTVDTLKLIAKKAVDKYNSSLNEDDEEEKISTPKKKAEFVDAINTINGDKAHRRSVFCSVFVDLFIIKDGDTKSLINDKGVFAKAKELELVKNATASSGKKGGSSKTAKGKKQADSKFQSDYMQSSAQQSDAVASALTWIVKKLADDEDESAKKIITKLDNMLLKKVKSTPKDTKAIEKDDEVLPKEDNSDEDSDSDSDSDKEEEETKSVKSVKSKKSNKPVESDNESESSGIESD